MTSVYTISSIVYLVVSWKYDYSSLLVHMSLCCFFVSFRFGGKQHHHYMLGFLKSVAEHYHGDGRAGDLIVDLLKLEVPKLFAVEGGGEKSEAESDEFSVFLRNYICRCNLKPTILGKMDAILVRNG